jgi:hypothetical protein
MIGGIDATNEASIRFHERLGFLPVAHFREVGRKFDRWLDLVFMQCFLTAPGESAVVASILAQGRGPVRVKSGLVEHRDRAAGSPQ